jgi:hypothetical protein
MKVILETRHAHKFDIYIFIIAYILYLKIDAHGGASTNLFSMLIFKLSNFEQLLVLLCCNHLVRKGVDVNEH